MSLKITPIEALAQEKDAAFLAFCSKAGVWDNQHDYVKDAHADGFEAGAKAASGRVVELEKQLSDFANTIRTMLDRDLSNVEREKIEKQNDEFWEALSGAGKGE